jgi:predicted DNA-binding transcriptional regulator YafY
MAEDHGVSRRTIERDIQFLREIGIVPAKTKGTE